MHANIVTHPLDNDTFELNTPYLSPRAARFLPITCGKVTLTQGNHATRIGITPERAVIALRKPGLPDTPVFLPNAFRHDLRDAVKLLKRSRKHPTGHTN